MIYPSEDGGASEEVKSYAVKINKTKVVINGGTRGQNPSAKRWRWPMDRKDGSNQGQAGGTTEVVLS